MESASPPAPVTARVGGAPTAEPAPREDPLPGSIVAGRYQIISRIGQGGMGAVYDAQHTVIHRRMAIKVLLEKHQDRRDLVSRMLQEARLASSIGHEHIVDVIDFGTTDDGRAFIAMEHLLGRSLGQALVQDGPLPAARALRIARQAASALAAAHGKGILHRDVKPENIFLVQREEEEFVKVLDFGISKVNRMDGPGLSTPALTLTGHVLGTPLYMSPEQARGEESLDARADVWALGVVMYECLTGEVPFQASNSLGVIARIGSYQPPPPSRFRPDLAIAPAVDEVVMRALEKDRERRWQTMAQMEQALARLLAGAGKRPRSSVKLLGAALVAAVAALVWQGTRDVAPRTEASGPPVTALATVPDSGVPAREAPIDEALEPLRALPVQRRVPKRPEVGVTGSPVVPARRRAEVAPSSNSKEAYPHPDDGRTAP